MLSMEEIIEYQQRFFNIWPPKHYFFLNGWILAFTGGITGRSNSVLTVSYTGLNLEKDIDFIESAYTKYGLPVRFKISDCLAPPELEEKLLKRDYIYSDYSIIAMGSEVLKKQANLNEELVYESAEEQASEFSNFLTAFASKYTEDQRIMFDITQRLIIPKKCFIIARKEKKIVGCILAVLDPQGCMYIAELFTHPDYRRQKIGLSLLIKAMHWGKNLGGRRSWLHVEKDNAKAITLYKKLGFQVWYSYRYLMRDETAT